MIHFDSTNFNGNRVIMRVDFNVPLNSNFEITDDTRIKGALSTIKKILTRPNFYILIFSTLISTETLIELTKPPFLLQVLFARN